MKVVILKFVLRQILAYVLGDRSKVEHAVALAEASYQEGDKAFTRRGRIYRSVKEWAPSTTPRYLVDLGTEVAATLDELSRSK